jgi:hypothetical protein
MLNHVDVLWVKIELSYLHVASRKIFLLIRKLIAYKCYIDVLKCIIILNTLDKILRGKGYWFQGTFATSRCVYDKKLIYKSCVQYLSLITYYAMQLFSIEKDAACSIGKVQNKVHFIEVKIILKKRKYRRRTINMFYQKFFMMAWGCFCFWSG